MTLKKGCPVTEAYLDELRKMADEYRKKGVQVIGISGTAAQTVPELQGWAADYDLPFPVFMDPGFKLIHSLGINQVPEFVLLNSQLDKVYEGAYDDQYSPERRRKAPVKSYVPVALKALLAGKKIQTPRTEAQGCELEDLALQHPGNLTYTHDIAPIINRSCVPCHRENGIADGKAFESYDEVVPWAQTIGRVVADGKMPPWGADKEHYPKKGFSNDRSLSHGDVEKILGWVTHGGAPGDLDHEPEPQEFPATQPWHIAKGTKSGKPDAVFDIGRTFHVPKHGELDYQYFTVPTNFKEEKCVKAVEVHPGAVQVVHHAIVHISGPQGLSSGGMGNIFRNSGTMVKVFNSFPPEKHTLQMFRNLAKIAELYDPKTSSVLGSYVPGESVRELAPGTAICIPAGATLTFEMHYTPNDEQTFNDRTQVGVMFTKKPEREVKTDALGVLPLTIPANDPNFHKTIDFPFKGDTDILSLQPHAHYLGKRWRYTLEYPDGTKKVILSVPNYSFDEQPVYNYAKPICAPKGSILHAEAVFDNSKWNPRNPNPDAPKTITWGFQSKDEMMNGWMTYVASKTPCAKDKR